MAWRIEIGEAAKNQLTALDCTAARRILNFLRERVAVLEDPRQLGRQLKGSKLGQLWRYRVGDYRVIASIEDDALVVLVVRIGHRREVYR